MSTNTTPTATEPLLTADEFMKQYGGETCVELFRGRVVRYPMPGGPHGYIISRVNAMLFNFAESNNLGRVFANDTFVRVRLKEATETLRGADIAYMSYVKMPPGDVPEGPLPVSPDLVVEVRSPSDRIPQMTAKASEYLEAGVTVVIVSTLIPNRRRSFARTNCRSGFTTATNSRSRTCCRASPFR